MNLLMRSVLIASALALPLGGCSSLPDAPSFDPTDWFAGDLFNSKKPLPGQRKEMFPSGVPGVARGVPADLVKGAQPASTEDAGIPQAAALLAEEPQPGPKPKPKAKPKPKPRVAAKPAPVAPASTPTSVTVRRAEQPPSQQQQQPGAVQWPDPPSQQRQAPSGPQWPDPPPPQ